jgi:hypothetical protein
MVVLPAVPNTNRSLIENVVLLRKPHTRSRLVLRNRKSGTLGRTWGTLRCSVHIAVQFGQQPINRSNLISF